MTHKGSSRLHATLKEERKTTKSILQSVGKSVIGQTKTTAALTEKIEKRDAKELLWGTVRALNNFQIVEKSERIESLMKRQKDSRRARHLALLKEY